MFHGERDTTVHPRNGEQVILQSVDSIEASYTRSTEQGQVPGDWLVHGAGHAWSGGSPLGSYTDPNGPEPAP